MNLLFCAAPCNVYTFLVTEVYPNAFAPFPPEVPDVPNYTACVNDNDCATVRAMHVRDKKMRADIITMNTTLANVFLEAMSSQVHASFQQWHLCKLNIVFVDLFLWFVNQYGKTTAEDLEANQQCMAANCHPANRFNTLILRLFTKTAYASSAGFRMNDVDIVNIRLHIIKQCKMYGKEYKAWIACKAVCPCTVKMVNTFKTFWAAKITLINQTAIPASMHGYEMVAVNNDNSVTLYGEPIANFGAAYAAMQESVKSQGAMIASMQGQMQAMHQYCMALGHQPPPWHLHITAATARPPQRIASTFNRWQKKSIPDNKPTARRISWQPTPVAATHPVQDV
jgi:hypothetical protein